MTTRLWLLAVGAGALFVIGLPPPAFARAPEEGRETRVTVNIKDQTLRDVLRDFSTQTKLVFRVEPDVPNVRLNLSIREITPETLVRLLVRQASVSLSDHSVTYSIERGIYLIKLGPPEIRHDDPPLPEPIDVGFQDRRLNRKLTFKVENEPIEKLLPRIFQGTGAAYQVQPEVRGVAVTVAVKDVSSLAAARLVGRKLGAKLPGAGLWQLNGFYVFGVVKPAKSPSSQP